MINRNTQNQRTREFIILLDEKLDYIRVKLCDCLHYEDKKSKSGGLKHRNVAWRLGDTEFLFRYDECSDQLGSATYRIQKQPYTPGETKDNWVDLATIGELDNALRNARRMKGYTANDKRAIDNVDKHDGDTPENLILVGLTGSKAYGLDHSGYEDPKTHEMIPPSDTDTRGVYVVPTKMVLSLPYFQSLNGYTELVEQRKTDTKYDEVSRFFELCLKCNPERLEMLASPKTLETEWGKLITENQDMFLSKRVIKTYGGYAKQQLYRIERKEERYTKPAMHLIRLLITGLRILEDGVVNPDMHEHREWMLGVRKGEIPMQEVFERHALLESRFAAAADKTKLPEEPDIERANSILLKIRKTHLTW